MAKKTKPKGWRKEKARHSLARKGIKTRRKKNKQIKQGFREATFWGVTSGLGFVAVAVSAANPLLSAMALGATGVSAYKFAEESDKLATLTKK